VAALVLKLRPEAGVAKRAGAARPLQVRVLGSVCVERGGERLELPPSKKTRALLAYLSIEGREQTREHLCSLFWDLPDDPRGALRWSLSRLRPLLDEPGRERIVADRERVSIDLAGARLDFHDTLALPLEGASAPELRAADELFRGELLEGLELGDSFRFQAWCTARREQARARHAQVLRALLSRLAGEEALAAARRLVSLEPADEAAHRSIIELLGKLGRPREAMQQYDSLREILRSTLGTAPSAETEHARRALGAPPAPAVVPPPAPGPPAPAQPPLVGRDSERAQLEKPWRAALLLGDPGIGKTRLLEELTNAGRVLRGRSYEAEQARPYGCIIEALRSSGLAAKAGDVLRRDLAALMAELAPPPEGLDRARLFDAVAALLREGGPATLALDDLHWIDEASAALAHYLVRTAPGVRLLLAAREGELADNAAALRLVRALRREHGLREVRLGPLDPPAVRALLASRGIPADADSVHRHSGGNPLLALETGRALAEGRPAQAGVLEALEQRLESLDEAGRSLLAWAAALGGATRPSLLARVTGRTEAEIVEIFAQLERRGLTRVLPSGDAFDFAHDLMREAALRRVPAARRKLLHAALARALWELPGPERQVLAGSAARQALLGGEEALAVRASAMAAQQAMSVFAWQEALALAEQGVSLLPALPREERLRQHLTLLHVRVHSDRRPERLERAAQELSRLVLEAEASGLSDVVAEGLHLISWAHYFREDEQGAMRGSLRSAEVARLEPDPLVRARSLAQAGRCLAQIEQEVDRAARLLDEAAAAAASARAVVIDVPAGRGMLAAFHARDADAREQLDLAATLSHETGDKWRETQSLFALCRLALDRRDPQEALRAASQALPVAEKMPEGDEPFTARGLLALAQVLDAQERRDPAAEQRALAAFEPAARSLLAAEARWRLSQLLLIKADLDMHAGRLEAVTAICDRIRGLGKEGVVQMRHGRAHVVLAELALARDDKAAAREQLALALTAPGSIGARMRARISAAAIQSEGGSHAALRGGA